MGGQCWYRSLYFENSSYAPIIASRTAINVTFSQIRSPTQVLHLGLTSGMKPAQRERDMPPLWACKCEEGGEEERKMKRRGRNEGSGGGRLRQPIRRGVKAQEF